MHGTATRLNRWLETLRNRQGNAAVEFAVIVPVILIMCFGVAELGNLLTVTRRTANVASAAADLVAQEKTTSTGGLQDVVSAASSIMTPYPTGPMRVVISSVKADGNNKGKVVWSYASSGAARGTNSSYTVPNGLTEANSSVIVAEVTYAFTPLFGTTYGSPGSFTISRTFYSRPRKSIEVAKSG